MAEQKLLAHSTPAAAPFNGASSARFSDLSKRLLGYQKKIEKFQEFNPEKPGPWIDEKDFYASLLELKKEVRVYKLAAHQLSIVIPEDYALVLDEVRNLRLLLENETAKEEAQQKLAEHKYGKRALPEDFLQELDELPDSSYFSRILLLDSANVADYWVRQSKKDYNADFISSAAVTPDGDLLNFRRELDEFLASDIKHEWSHRLAARYPEDEMAFRQAILAEQEVQDWYVPSAYALSDFAEHWAVYGERMLSPDDALFASVSERSPCRALVFLNALKKSMGPTEPEPGSFKSVLSARCQKSRKLLLARAKAFLASRLAAEDSTPAAKERAFLLLAYFNAEFPV